MKAEKQIKREISRLNKKIDALHKRHEGEHNVHIPDDVIRRMGNLKTQVELLKAELDNLL